MAAPLVTTEWLKNELEKESKSTRTNLVVLDATWVFAQDGYELYLK